MITSHLDKRIRAFVVIGSLLFASSAMIWVPYSILFDVAGGKAPLREIINDNEIFFYIPNLIGLAAANAYFSHRAKTVFAGIFLPLIFFSIYTYPVNYLFLNMPVIVQFWYLLAAAIIIFSIPPYCILKWMIRRHEEFPPTLLDRAALFAAVSIPHLLVVLMSGVILGTYDRFQ